MAKNGKSVDAGTNGQSAVIVLDVPQTKLHSVRFGVKKSAEGGPSNPIVRDLYIDRLAAMKLLGVQDLDAVRAVKVTIELAA
jgi:hypothetical protein